MVRSRITAARRTLIAVALNVLAVTAAFAVGVGQGRIQGTVQDSGGKPLAGVKVSITSPEVASLRVDKTTDNSGQFSAVLIDAQRAYRIHFQKDDYEVLEQPLKLKMNDSLSVTFTLQSSAAKAAAVKVTSAPIEGAESAAPAAAAGPNPEAVRAYNEGVAALKAKDTATAVTKVEEAEKLDPKLAAAPALLADLYLEQKRAADAVAAADRALALEPGKVKVMLVRYQALRAVGDKARAAQALNDLAAAKTPDVGHSVAVMLYNDAADASRAKDTPAVISNLRRALDFDPTLEPAYGALANAYMASADFKSALAVADRWVAAAPDSVKAMQLRYDVLVKLNDPRAKEAKAALDAKSGGAKPPK